MLRISARHHATRPEETFTVQDGAGFFCRLPLNQLSGQILLIASVVVFLEPVLHPNSKVVC